MKLTKIEAVEWKKNNNFRKGKAGGNMGIKGIKQGVCFSCETILLDSSDVKRHKDKKHEVVILK